jgi:xanthine dehydrogenase YagR molybdenum-binding subunit
MSSRGAGPIGMPLNRVDGRLKVTGGARYAAEAQVANVAHGVLVLSTIGSARVTRVRTAAAEKAPGVLAVLTHRETS